MLAHGNPGDALIALLVITDGRDDYLARCVASANEQLRGPISERWMFDDTGDDTYRRRLAKRFPRFQHINGGPRQGFGGAINSAWRQLAEHSSAEYVLHIEQDFTFNRPVDLTQLATVLRERPHLAQLALRRQPWNDAETAAGGIVELHPDAYEERYDQRGQSWLEHRLFFTTNPSLYRRDLCEAGWPTRPQSEGHFGIGLLRDGLPWGVSGPDVRFGFWGARADPPWVEHIGHQRVGSGY